MIELSGKEGELKAVIQVTRKETGKVETYEIVGKVNHDEVVKAGLVNTLNAGLVKSTKDVKWP